MSNSRNPELVASLIAGNLLNHLCYADDIWLILPLLKLLNICNEYAFENDLLFNNKQTVRMNFKPSKRKVKDPTLYLKMNSLTVKYE